MSQNLSESCIKFKTESQVMGNQKGDGFVWKMKAHIEGPDDFLEFTSESHKTWDSAFSDMCVNYGKIADFLLNELGSG